MTPWPGSLLVLARRKEVDSNVATAQACIEHRLSILKSDRETEGVGIILDASRLNSALRISQQCRIIARYQESPGRRLSTAPRERSKAGTGPRSMARWPRGWRLSRPTRCS